ncbi:proton-coupled folate transporter-like [Dendronephthya gigantea]|uniref:proton-coupled folate transporter-like n=1 Tax=Dendronephthya gigantea TaxID=151771 RepID=UPI00106BA24B|nr:proton-coupled folate transporter-like [Dendronephthya gigantea]XP_028414328.1 proton-coupled folate transporter-like [Dendronephthya gigantea]
MGNPYRAITVEPVVMLYITALLMQLPVYQHYVYHRAQVELNLERNGSDLVDQSRCDANTSELVVEIQRRASSYILAIGMAGTFPAIFTSLIYGPMSDRKGRIPIMRLPLLGSVIDGSMTLFTIYFELPLYVIAIGSAISGLCGHYTTLVFTVTAYVKDTTSDPAKLSLRLARLEAMALFSGTIAQVTSGLWVEHLGYAAPYLFIFACQLCAFLYVALFLPESLQQLPLGDRLCLNCGDFRLLTGVIINKREDRGRLKILLLLLVSAFTLLPVGVLNSLSILYAKDSPLCWRADLIGYFLGCLFFVRAVGAVACMKILKKFAWKDYSVVQLGSVFLMGLLIMIGLSTTTLEMFLATIPCLMAGLPQPCIRALTSHIVGYSEQGSLFSIIASIESLCNFLANIIFNPVYQASLDYSWPHANGLIFFINAGIVFLPFVIISYLKFYDNKFKGYEAIGSGIRNSKSFTTSTDSATSDELTKPQPIS